MKKSTGKSILLAKNSKDAYLEPTDPIFLLPNGNIVCGKTIIKADYQVKHQYPFIRDYLKTKKLKFDITNFRYMDLGDVIESLQYKNAKSISYKNLIEIYVYRNQISRIRDYKIHKIKKLAYKRFWRKIKQLTIEKNIKESERLHDELRKRQEIVHLLINHKSF